MFKRLIRFPLKTKFQLLYLVFVIIPFLSLSCYFYFISYNQVKTNIYFASQTIFSQTRQLLSYYMYNISYSMNTLVGDRELVDIAEKESSHISTIDMVTDMLYLMDQTIIYRNKQELVNVTIYLNNNAEYISETSMIKSLSDIENEAWLQYTQKAQTLPILIPSQYLESTDILSMVRPIFSPYSYETVTGIVRFDLSKAKIEEMINRFVAENNNLIYLVNSNNEIIAQNSDDLVTLPFPNLTQSADGMAHDINIDGIQYICYVDMIENTDWYLVNLIPYLEIQKQFFAKNTVFFLAFFAVTTLGFLFAYLFIRFFLNRISSLQKHMTGIQTSLSPYPVTKETPDEIGDLIHAYNNMLSKATNLMEEQYKLGNQIKEAELKALYEQINPHFLYNTLSMINWLAEEEQTQDVSNVITALSNFYKLSLNKGNSLIPLREELQIIKSFIYIQKMRFGTDIELECSCPPEYENFILPKLTLQPLVENALVHGILMKKDKSGLVKIEILPENTSLLIRISDNGIGMEPEITDKLNQGTLQTSEKHYGINNIMQRLRLQHGQQCSIAFKSIAGAGTSVTLQIPLMPNT